MKQINVLFQSGLDKLAGLRSILACALLFNLSVINAQERIYHVPPSTEINVTAPYISDVDMEQCVETYNKATWLKQELEKTYVDLAQPAQVEAYNSKASQYSQMADYYNLNCAGKHSKAAIKAAQNLNWKINQ